MASWQAVGARLVRTRAGWSDRVHCGPVTANRAEAVTAGPSWRVGIAVGSRAARFVLVLVIAADATTRLGASRLAGVTAVGSERFTEAEIALASGLVLGSEIDQDSVKAAAKKLAGTGVFAEVNYLYKPSAEGAEVEFRVSDGKKLAPARFENFVWFSDRELQDELTARVPLFHGDLATAGTLEDDVRRALSAMLKEKDLPGTVRGSLVGGEKEGIAAVQFRIEGVNIRFRGFVFPGARGIDAASLQQAVKPLVGTAYDQSFLKGYLARNVAPLYIRRGLLRARLAEPVPTVIPGAPDEIAVSVSIAVLEGRAYRVAAIRFTGGTAIGEKELAERVHLAPGQPADSLQLANDLAGMRALCASRGFLRADVGSETRYDDEAGAVTYEIKVREGDLYRMGKLEFEGVEASRVEGLRKACRIKEGDPFDETYWSSFLSDIASHLPADSRSGTVRLTRAVHDREKTVDVKVEIATRPSS